jgi:energy-coupling factor transport system ATP-binding protein
VSFIDIRNVSFRYPEDSEDHLVLKEINLAIKQGEFLSIVGANSSGKSTLGRLMNALYVPVEGSILVDGMLTSDVNNVMPIRRLVGMIFQNPDNQIVATTVEEEVAFGPENLCFPCTEIRQRVDEALELTGLTPFKQMPPHLLSGGQKQLLAIASVLSMRPTCIVFDEPTSLLDPKSRKMLINKIVELNQQGITIVLITHRMEEVLLSQRTVVLFEGRIVKNILPTDLFHMNEKELHEYKLYPPEIIKIVSRLKQKGLDIPSTVLSTSDLVNFLCPLQ